MTLREFIDKLNRMHKHNPDVLNYTVVFSRDDEGNGFDKVNFDPSLGYYHQSTRDFDSEENLKEEYDGDVELNAVCIN